MEVVTVSLNNIDKVYSKILEVLNKAGLIVFPTDTVYGFLTDATTNESVAKIFKVKRRDKRKPVSVFLPSKNQLKNYVLVEKKHEDLLNYLLPGPYTLVMYSEHKTSKFIESSKNTLGVRVPSYRPVRDLSLLFGKALTATSANISGQGPYHTIPELLNSLSVKEYSLIDLVVDVGSLPYNDPSTVIDLTSGIRVLRKGSGFSKLNAYIKKLEPTAGFEPAT